MMRYPKPERWRQMPWWQKAAICCSQPTLFYSLMFAFVGLMFMLGAFYLDPDMRSC